MKEAPSTFFQREKVKQQKREEKENKKTWKEVENIVDSPSPFVPSFSWSFGNVMVAAGAEGGN